ncbi:hypothetical protein A9Q84_16740 [Halobacteriovorax marinus]|uniref:Metallo-beta-lactamase domain-containing protein n=1 Tax=Halobacteriovorax marinus TaxID=97084 RepID=A0A1Y5FAA6_9BACT|nr:hypothetical protein A9Q84_16740 [Halobacteriovorax marinus]
MKISKLSVSILFFTILSFTACATFQSHSQLSIKSFTSNLSGFSVNSHLIMGEKEAILVDAQFTRSQADRVVEMVRESGRKLQMIYITHGHPDHYLGLERILKAFPGTLVKAKMEVIETIRETAQGKIDYWKATYKDDLADTYTLPTELNGDDIYLEGHLIEVVDLGAGESAHNTALYIPSSKTLISGDSVYGNVHVWLFEERLEHVLLNLYELKKLDVLKVLPGHGESGSRNLILENIKYVQKFKDLTSNQNYVIAKEKMLEIYGTYKLPIILELSLKANIK